MKKKCGDSNTRSVLLRNSREYCAKMNIASSLLLQMVNLLCGFAVPKVMISYYGSEVYGATTSIIQFLSYITLLEGGLGGIARAALYKPLAEKNNKVIGEILKEMQSFFRIVAFAFLCYTTVVAVLFKAVANLEVLDWISTVCLVYAISISTFFQYYVGISNAVLLQAAQKNYISNMLSILIVSINAFLTIILVCIGCDIITVKLVSSCVFLLRPVGMMVYVRKYYSLNQYGKCNKRYLQQKWTGLGQHIAFFLHSNTDIMILTVFADLSKVAVYSVYYMIVAHIQNLTTSFASGMEALFGELIAKDEHDTLNRTFDKYETLISIVSVIMLSVTAVMIMPFVDIYTKGITDANYKEPIFAVILILASVLYCLRMPYHAVVIAAGHFKQTRFAAYGEAALNIGLSVALVSTFGLLGVALGTLFATAFRFIYYVWYLSKEIACRPLKLFAKRIFVNAVCFAGTMFLGNTFTVYFEIENYWLWACAGFACMILATAITLGFNMVFYRKDLGLILEMFAQRKGKR